MRIVYAVTNHYWEDLNLLDGLRRLGHDVVIIRPGHPFHEVLGADWSPEDRRRVSAQLVSAVADAHREAPVDLLFAYFIDALVEPEAVREIGAMGIHTVNYYCNGAHQFHLVQKISPAFDHCITTERKALPDYDRVGARSIYLQMAANPDVYRPYDLPVEHDVTFVGQRYADRPQYVAYLLEHGIDVRVWGPGWTVDRTFGEKPIDTGTGSWAFARQHPRAALRNHLVERRRRQRLRRAVSTTDEKRLAAVAGPSLSYDELVKMYSRSKINLGFSTTGDTLYGEPGKVLQVRLRDFEAPMSGGLYFVELQEELAEFYEIDREIVCYSSREELLEKVRYYLAHPEAADAVRRAGHARAQRDHTWERRFTHLFELLAVEGRA